MKRVLFICVANACRSQIADGFARALGGEVLEAYSAGSYPVSSIHPMTVQAMHEVGVDMSRAQLKGLRDLPCAHFDIAISLCDDSCPQAMADEHRQWKVANPDMCSPEQFHSIRDNIKRRVEQLIAEMHTVNC